MNLGVDFKNPHKMAEIGFFPALLEHVLCAQEFLKDPRCDFYDVELAEEVLFVLQINLAIADKDMEEGLLNQHVEDIVFLVLKHQADEASKE